MSDATTPTPLFAFPLFSTLVGGHEEHKEGLIAEILDYRSKYPGLVRSNRGGWHSGEEFTRSRNEHVGWLLRNVTTYARDALAPYYKQWATSELRLGSYWANVNGPGGFNAPHHHFPQHWSGVYYVSMPPIAAGDLSGMIEFVNPNPWQSTFGLGNYAYGPKEGLTLLWPSSLVHYVHPHHQDVLRISVAYNFNVVAKAR